MLESKVLFLLEQIQRLGIKTVRRTKDWHNSSLPTSGDIILVVESLRTPSVRKNGGQRGHTVHTLIIREIPNKIIELKSLFCNNCGQFLTEKLHVLKTKRQVVQIQPIQPVYEEYYEYGCECPRCKHEQIANFPLGINASIQCGGSVQTLISYLSVYQFIPFKCLKNLFLQVFSVLLSENSIVNVGRHSASEHSAPKCNSIYQIIKQKIADSSVIGDYEIGAKVNSQKWWLRVWQNALNTFIVASDNRGFKAVESVWKHKIAKVILVSDRWTVQLRTQVKNHQICLAHMLRKLVFLSESQQHTFTKQFNKLITIVFNIRKTLLMPCSTNSTKAIELQNL